jgi:DNA-binding response OmpR family regulator
MKNILLIEDNLAMRENTAEILELSNYKVSTAANGKEGVKMANAIMPDLIICDIMMPELDGYGVLHMLSRNEQTAGIPFIFLTAKVEKSDVRKGMNLGADDYITKPFDDAELLTAVESRLKRHDRIKKEYETNAAGINLLLSDFSVIEDLKKNNSDRKTKSFKKKDFIYSEGAYPHSLFMVKSGKVKTVLTNMEGKEYINDLFNEGDIFGFQALLEDSKYTDTAIALENAEISIIPKDDFYRMMLNNRDLSVAFIKLLSNILHEKEERLIQLAYNSVRKRVAEALVLLYNKYHDERKSDFEINISREDLSNIVGTATETVIRTLSDFKEEGLIEVKAGNIKVINLPKLQKMKN